MKLSLSIKVLPQIKTHTTMKMKPQMNTDKRHTHHPENRHRFTQIPTD